MNGARQELPTRAIPSQRVPHDIPAGDELLGALAAAMAICTDIGEAEARPKTQLIAPNQGTDRASASTQPVPAGLDLTLPDKDERPVAPAVKPTRVIDSPVYGAERFYQPGSAEALAARRETRKQSSNRLATLLVWLLFGQVGGHHFYRGKTFLGLVYLAGGGYGWLQYTQQHNLAPLRVLWAVLIVDLWLITFWRRAATR